MRQANVENLAQSDKTDVSNALFNMDTKLRCLPSPRTCSRPWHVSEDLLEIHFFEFFRARGGDKFITHVLEIGTRHVRDALKQHHFLRV